MEQINPINKVTLKDKMKSYTRHPGSLILLLLVLIAAALTVVTLLFLVGYILISGIPYLKPSLFALHYNSDNVSMLPAIINTVEMVLVSLLFSVPFGVGAAIYMIEYARKGNKFVEVVRLTAETLTGIPSIIYGLFGMLFFNIALHWRYSMLSGAATLAIMVLPTIMRTTEEALLCVPDSYREGSFGLGAGKLRTIFKIVLPAAIPGILSGIILSIGRIVGESAALLFTAGSGYLLPKAGGWLSKILQPGGTLTIQLYLSSSKAEYNVAFGIAFVLLVIVLCINFLTKYLAKRFDVTRMK